MSRDCHGEPGDGPRRRAVEANKTHIEEGVEPETVAAAVVAALEAKHHRLRHPSGREARKLALLSRFAPAAAFARGLRKRFHVDAEP